MPLPMERLALLRTIDDVLAGAQNLEDAVRGIAACLGEFLAVDRVSVRAIAEDMKSVTVVALWSSRPAAIGVGATMSVLSTSIPEILATGRPAIGSVDTTLLESVLLDEGIRSWVTLPIRDPARLRAVLSLSSRTLAAFDGNDETFFTDLASSVEPHIVGLLDK